MIAIVDYGMGNLRSVANAFEYLGAKAMITADLAEIRASDRLVLPGVGAFGDAMRQLDERGLTKVLQAEVIDRTKPFLGICLGMQLLARFSSEHGEHRGLGWIDSDIRPLGGASDGLKVPHIGWNDIQVCVEHPLFAGLPSDKSHFYFVHSFHMVAHEPVIAARCDYGVPFVAAVARRNIFATQFHPEKSQDNGLQLLQNFVSWQPDDLIDLA